MDEHPVWFQELNKIPPVQLYRQSNVNLSKIPDKEREFFWDWCGKRHLEDIFAVVGLTYWVRARAEVAINFLVRQENKKLYMILCIHLALKWLGYDEEKKCNFFSDLVEEDKSEYLRPEIHQRMEIDLLRALNWDMS